MFVLHMGSHLNLKMDIFDLRGKLTQEGHFYVGGKTDSYNDMTYIVKAQ